MSHLTHPDLPAALPRGIRLLAPDLEAGVYTTTGEEGAAEATAELAARGWSFDLDDGVTAAWVSGFFFDPARPFPRGAVAGFAAARTQTSYPAGTVSLRLVTGSGGAADWDALDAAGATLKSWRVDALATPTSVTSQ